MKPVPVPATFDCVPPVNPHHRVGDAVQDAYNAALAARVTALNDYTAANNNLGTDITRYNADNSTWTAEQPNMGEPDKTTCYNAMNDAYTSLGTESNNVNAAYTHIGAGDADMTSGDNAQQQQQKVMYYNSAKTHYQASSTASASAGGNHTTVGQKLDIAEPLLQKWGP